MTEAEALAAGIKDRQSGMAFNDIAAKYNLDVNKLIYACRKSGVRLTPEQRLAACNGVPLETKEAILNDRRMGISKEEISTKYKVNLNTVADICKKAKVKLNPDQLARSGGRITPEIKALVIADRNTGLKSADIAAKYNLDVRTVQYVCNSAGVKLSPEQAALNAGSVTEETKQLIYADRRLGMKSEEIAQKYGISARSVLYLCQQAGIQLDPSNRNRKHSKEIDEKIVQLYKDEPQLSRQDIAVRLGVKLSKVKTVLNQNGITKDMATRQNIAYQAKLAKNPNAMSAMREALTPEVRARQGETLKTLYNHPDRKEIFAKQQSEKSKSFWDNLSEEERAAFIASRNIASQNSPANKEWIEKLKAAKGFNNFKTQSIMSRLGVSSYEEWMQKYADNKNGQFIGPYVDVSTKTWWKCANPKHTQFEMTPGHVRDGQWCPACAWTISKPHQQIADFIEKELNIPIVINDRSVIGPKELDIYVPSHNLGIEYNGLYFHSEAKEGFIPNSHADKAKACAEKGVKLFAIFEDEWRDKPDLIKSMIKSRLGLSDKVIYARKCEVVKLEKNSEFEPFFEANHLNGHTLSMFAYGLIYEGQLVMCASFRKHQNTGKLEIARMASLMNTNVVGGASKILSRINEPLVTYSDNRISVGKVYSELGFKEDTVTTQPGYWYTDLNFRYWRTKCQKVNDPEIVALYPTEREQALGGVFSPKLNGTNEPLFRIEDYGSRRWVRD